MPNHVENIITLKGDEKKIREMLEAIKNDDYGLGTVDFNKIIPMPESLNIEAGSRTDKGLKAYSDFIDVYVFGRNAEEALNAIRNISKESEDAFLRQRTDVKIDEWELGKTAWNNIQNYGAPTWYEWSINNWGTKWNAYGYDESADYSQNTDLWFQTAWSAPHPILQKLSEMYPDITFEHEWADEDLGANCGRKIYSNSECTEEYYPESQKDAIEFACRIWDYDHAELDLMLNKAENGYINIENDKFDLISLFGKPAQINLVEELSLDLSENDFVFEFEKLIKKSGFEFEISQLKKRLNSVNDDIKSKGFIYYKKTDTELLTGYDYLQFYDWDLYFENIYQLYNGVSKFCFTNLDAFFLFQKKDGFIKRSFGTRMYGIFHPFKPFIAQTILLGCSGQNDYSFAEKNLHKIERFLQSYYKRYDYDNNLLCCWKNADASGMDNQTSRVLRNGHGEGVDLNCYLYREYLSLSLLAEKIGETEKAELFKKKAELIKEKINEYLWDDKTGFYYDRNDKNGKLNMVKGISGFVPLWAGVASKEQAKRLVEEHLLNNKEFASPYPITTLSMDSPAYAQYGKNPPSGICNWNGPLWVPMNYMVFHGLMDYGYNEIAKDIALKTFEAVFFKNSVTREYYNAVTGEGYGRNPFYGWSVLAYFMPLEYLLSYNPTRINDEAIKPLAKTF